jgi:methionyl-tRNA formyltransferase
VRIFIVTQEESVYLPTFLDDVLRVRAQNVCGMLILPEIMPNASWFTTLRDHLSLYGLPGFVRLVLRYGTHRVLDRLQRLGLPVPGLHSVRAAAARHRVTLSETRSINDPAFLESLRALAPDVVVSVNASQKFGRRLLDLPRWGCINVHGALLPRYRGRLPSFWVLANGEQETGATVHVMNADLDDGPIIRQERLAIEPSDTQHTLIRKTKRLGSRLLLEALDLIESGRVVLFPNDRSRATYYSFPKRDIARRVRAARGRLM